MYDVSVALRSLPDPFTTAQAVDIGVSEHVLARLVRRGDAQRLSRGVYRQRLGADSGASVHALRRWQVLHRDFLTRARAALASYPHHALSHATAALVCGWPVVLHPQMPVHLTAVRVEPRSRRVDDRVLHHSDSIINDVVVVEGLRVLTA
ncbi:MAG: type IV toxin-antitoxin system AbiEi family antitoxin domain-containing protein, partial [Nocardioidaceae bacterium]